MASVRLEGIKKTYPNGHVAAQGLDLEIVDGEFMVLVGPSGCGKSTALRMIAGLETPTGGRILIGDRDVTVLPPQERDIAMVFQTYALYPHMTVRENLGFGLRMRGAARDVITRRVEEAARALSLEPVLERKPAQLSGGQRQRVALGRAIVREPKVFLFDEPLSNLDAKLRVETRAELARLHRRLGATIVYVTHDQEEAMTLGSRVAVMRDGFLQQVAPPMELYRRPANHFVAGFVGSPAMNFLPAEEVPRGLRSSGATLGIRPHDLTIVAEGAGDDNAWVELVESRGSENLIYLCLRGNNQGPAIRVVAPPETPVEPERMVGLRFDREKLHWFDEASGIRLSS
jgi:multiple sugar transport system ATP-binding protein